MKLERLHEYILSTVVILLGIGFSLYAGSAVGKGQPKTVIIVLVALPLLIVAAKYTTKLWVLIPLSSGLTGVIVGLPLGLPLKSMAAVYVFLVFLVLKVFKIVRKGQVFGMLDVLLLLNLLYLGFVFMRNPVGALGVDSDRIGGRPYFDVGMAWCAYWVLSIVTVSPSLANRLPVFMILGSVFESLAGFFSTNVPSVAGPLGRFYSSFYNSSESSPDSSGYDVGGSRLPYLASLGGGIPQTLSCYYNPATFINPLFMGRFLLFLGSVGMLFLAGFRSCFFSMVLTLLLTGYLRSGIRQVLKIALFPLPLLAVLVVGQGIAFNLPLTAQRTLSFLPGHWNQEAINDAIGSTEWRVEMWKDALFTDSDIKDKIFGDGFGVSRKTWESVQYAVANHLDLRLQAEEQAIMGGFHNGPLSTIRVVGYIGLTLFYITIITIAVKAWGLVRRSKNTLYFPLALLICIPAILHPFIFTFVYGAFDNDMSGIILRIGMLNLLENSLFVHLKTSKPEAISFVRDVRENGNLQRKTETLKSRYTNARNH